MSDAQQHIAAIRAAPRWTGGAPVNLQAAALDAMEWLLMIRRRNDSGLWPLGDPDSRRRLDGCIDALREQMLEHLRPEPDGYLTHGIPAPKGGSDA